MHLPTITVTEAKVSYLCIETYIGWRDALTSCNHQRKENVSCMCIEAYVGLEGFTYSL